MEDFGVANKRISSKALERSCQPRKRDKQARGGEHTNIDTALVHIIHSYPRTRGYSIRKTSYQ